MSRTEGINLPRLPTSHARLTSPQSMNVHPAINRPTGTAGGDVTNVGKQETTRHRRSISEPSYTAYLGTPRQDIPRHVYHNAAMYDDVFDKRGKLFQSRDTPKITNPLNSLGYSSLHDPHCRKLFLNNKALRSHLMDLGLITDDLKVVASTHEQRQKIRAHELLERKETLLFKLEMQEQQRIERLQRGPKQLPSKYRESILKAEERRERAEMVKRMKVDKAVQAQEKMKILAEKRRQQEKRKMQQAIEEARLFEQAKRNAARYRQETAELAAYEKQYGKMGCQLALWHRDSDRIHNRMIVMERTQWSKGIEKKQIEISETTKSKPKSPQSEAAPIPLSTENGDEPQKQDSSPTTEIEPSPTEQLVDSEISQNVDPSQEQKKESTILKSETLEANGMETDPPDKTEESIPDTEIEEDIAKLKISDEETVPMQLLDRNESEAYLVRILVDDLQRIDHQRFGFVSVDEFSQVLNSRDLGLQLNENEIVYIAEQADAGNGWVPFVAVAQQLPNLLVAMYTQRAETQMQQYGGYMEDQWCQMYLSSGVVYYNKLTGEMLIGGRPDNFRPYLKEDPFEESIVDFFETADTDKDGVININNFYSLLVSPMVSTRIYSNQMEDLLVLFQENSDSGLATLEIFAPVAKTLLIMIYQNAYPDVEEWIELDSRKVGTFLFNKETGETYIPEQPTDKNQRLEQTNEATVDKSPKIKKHGMKKVKEPTDNTTETTNSEKATEILNHNVVTTESSEQTANNSPSPPKIQSSAKEDSTFQLPDEVSAVSETTSNNLPSLSRPENPLDKKEEKQQTSSDNVHNAASQPVGINQQKDQSQKDGEVTVIHTEPTYQESPDQQIQPASMRAEPKIHEQPSQLETASQSNQHNEDLFSSEQLILKAEEEIHTESTVSNKFKLPLVIENRVQSTDLQTQSENRKSQLQEDTSNSK